MLACLAAFLAAGTLALAAVAAAVAVRSSSLVSSSDGFLSEEAGGGVFGGGRGTWPATGAPECAWRSWRLPREVAPRRYRLSLSLSDLESDGAWVEGDVAMDLSLVSPLSSSPSSSASASSSSSATPKPQRCIVLHAADPVRLESASITVAVPRKKKEEEKEKKGGGGVNEEEEEEAFSSSSPLFDVSTHRITTWRLDSSTVSSSCFFFVAYFSKREEEREKRERERESSGKK